MDIESFLERLRDSQAENEDDDDNDNDYETTPLAAKEFSPLRFLVMCKASLPAIREVHQMNPEALTSELLFDACQHGAQKGVIPYLAKNLKLMEFNDDLDLPIHIAMEHGPGPDRPSTEDLKSLINIRPGCLSVPSGSQNLTPLELSIVWDYDLDFFTFLATTLVCGNNEARLNLRSEDTEELLTKFGDHLMMEKMGLILARIRDFYSDVVSWSADGYARLLDCLTKSKSLRTIHLKIPAHLDTEETFQQIRQLATRNPSIECLRINGEKKNNCHMMECGTLLKELRPAPNITKFVISNFVCRNDRSVIEFLSSSNVPKHVTMDNIRVLCDNYSGSGLRNSGVEVMRLAFSGYPETQQNSQWYCGLFNDLVTMPRLESLLMTANHGFDFTEQHISELSKLLKYGRLQHFRMAYTHRWCNVQVGPLLSSLKGNTNLRTIDLGISDVPSKLDAYERQITQILREDNKVLGSAGIGIDCDDTFDSAVDTKHYFLTLNVCGRALAGNPNTSAAKFNDLLTCIPERALAVWEETVLLYGLLREAPGVWCTPAGYSHQCGHKRKNRS